MSHELRTPLSSIIGFSDVLRTRLAPRASERELQFPDNIAESGRHLLALIDNVLDLAKIEDGKMDVNLETVSRGWREPTVPDGRPRVRRARPFRWE